MLNLDFTPDPAERKQISEYSPNLHDRVRRYYIKEGPCQPCNHKFPKRIFGGLLRQFNSEWFNTSYSAVGKKHYDVDQFFDIVANVLNTIGSSFKCGEMLREDQAQKLEELFMLGEVDTESGLNQELGLQRQEIPVGDLILRQCITILHYSRQLFMFLKFLQVKLSELNSRFDAVNSDLLLGMYSISKLEDLNYDLDNYILYVREDRDFFNLKGLGDLSEILVETEQHKTWGLIYLLVKLSLILLVATATVERVFSSMKYIKNDLRSRIGIEFINYCLVCYIEDEVFESIPNDAIIDRFQNMTSRQAQL
ncbi:uncharacterized protein [Nicotiana tomentosiformis]|uniref:uncharacterized protein n=1 Tax=Nicotiana tomentosiformis TaxID=4098 RepID=UPI00388C4286